MLPLRVLLALLFAGLLVGQVMSIPGQFAYMAQEQPDLAHLRWPFTVIGILGLACVQVVVVCTWRLLTMVKDDRIFTEASLRWVDPILWAAAVAWVLLATVFVLMLPFWDGPGTPALVLGMLTIGAVFGLLLLVMRSLLLRATSLRTDMDAVI